MPLHSSIMSPHRQMTSGLAPRTASSRRLCCRPNRFPWRSDSTTSRPPSQPAGSLALVKSNSSTDSTLLPTQMAAPAAASAISSR